MSYPETGLCLICLWMSCSKTSRHISAMKASGRSCAHVRRAAFSMLPMLDLREKAQNSESLAIKFP